ncbi:hypothetical protein EW026_g325 [Hermanssonia centrifuga]|uniref:Uncharacterized protein n=1 Tax=Hermanssonia centrifuga TaxID=98765 RepID=A0A4V3XBM3_9APHY|nr:hypothetical protein EW026_g325 [Hermanssonia centrifuga]
MVVRRQWPCLLLYSLCFVLIPKLVAAYEVSVSDSDYDRQICSGMWGGKNTFINVTFDSSSQGQLAMVVYEWRDMQYLGKVTSEDDDYLPQKTYVCTSDAVRGGFCDSFQLGHFILDLPQGKSVNETSFWSARVGFSSSGQAPSDGSEVTTSGFWDNPEGNPTPPPDENSDYTTPWLRSGIAVSTELNLKRQDDDNASPTGILWYKDPIQYLVRKTGYYCVAIVPVTVLSSSGNQNLRRQAPTDVPFHPKYQGSVLFQNTFKGKLPAAEYPKVNSIRVPHSGDGCELGGTTSTVFLIVVAILDAGRNALSFFLLLIVSLGLSVVRESLGSTMIRCQLLAVAHFIFGVLYAVGIVELELESTSAFVLLLFVVPLAFTLSGFLLWILYSLNATTTQLAARKQRYKLRMFKWLYRILLMTVVMVAIFFVVSSMTFSGRLAEDYGARSWRLQWWLLDGWLALLYLVDFIAIAISTLAMFDELAQDEEDAEDYDMEALERRTEAMEGHQDDDDAATLVGGRRPGIMAEDAVVFEIGDEDAQELSDDEDNTKKRHVQSGRGDDGEDYEREGLFKED